MVKSKRAKEAADSAIEPPTTDAIVGSSATHDKPEHKVKKRKRDVEEVNGADEEAAAVEKKKSKKDKKDKKTKKHDKESRKEKKDKRKNLQDLPEEVVEDAEEGDEDEAGETPQKAEVAANNGDANDAEAKRKEEKRLRKLAKQEKKQRKHQEAEQGTGSATTSKSNDKTSASATAASTSAKGEDDPIDLDEPSAADGDQGKKDRHIVFVGNLPFSATAASISAHFASLSPVAVRCLRNRDDPNPCRGIAFVEFGKVWHQRTCLDKFHHSTFDDGVSPARKINVELTAGGGGKTKQRQQKIKDKNKKLDENRAKRIEREKTSKQEGADGTDGRRGAHQEETMHPSRRARIPGGGW